MADVKLSAKSEIDRIIADMTRLKQTMSEIGTESKRINEEVSKNVENNVKRTEGFFSKMTGFGRRVADQLRSDFKTLFSLEALQGSLKLSSNMKAAAAETVTLSDTVRKLGGTFGIAQRDFAGFQAKVQSGLGEIGASSEAAANALKGLSETGVRGQENLVEYAKAAAMLASVHGEKGNEAAVAKGIAGLVTARGQNVNDPQARKRAVEDITRISTVTGKSASETAQILQDLFSNVNEQFKGMLNSKGASSLAATALYAGPGATSFLQRYLGMSKVERAGMEAQGLGKIISPTGQLDQGAVERTLAEAKTRGMGDIQTGLKTFGMSDEEAKGFIRLGEALKNNKQAIEDAANAQVDLNKAYREGMGMGEAFKSSFYKIFGKGSELFAKGTQGLTDVLSGASESTAGAGAVVGGSALLAAILAGTGLKGVGKAMGGAGGGLLGGLAMGKAAEAAGVQPVFVVNADQIGTGVAGNLGGLLGKGGGMLGKAGGALAGAAGMALPALGVAAAGGVGYGIGTLIDKFGPTFEGKTQEGFEGSALERLFFKLDRLIGGETSGEFLRQQKILVELNERELRATKQPTRGASN